MNLAERFYLTENIEQAIRREKANAQNALTDSKLLTLAHGKISGLQEALNYVRALP